METTSSLAMPAATMPRILSSGTDGLRSSGLVAVFSSSQTPTASTMTKCVLCLRIGRDALQHIGIDHAAAATFHLLEVAERADVAHEDQAFERLHIGARGDHVHRDRDARVVGRANCCNISSGFLPCS